MKMTPHLSDWRAPPLTSFLGTFFAMRREGFRISIDYGQLFYCSSDEAAEDGTDRLVSSPFSR